MKFKYTIEVVPNSTYGSWDLFNKRWSGMMDYLVERVGFAATVISCRKYISLKHPRHFT